MISAWHLLWIIPLMSAIAIMGLAFVAAGNDTDNTHRSSETPPLDEDMNRHSGLLEDE